jgi:glycerol transport system ATP-binding protein
MARILIDKLRHSYVQNPQKPEDYALKEMSLELADGPAAARPHCSI